MSTMVGEFFFKDDIDALTDEFRDRLIQLGRQGLQGDDLIFVKVESRLDLFFACGHAREIIGYVPRGPRADLR